MMIQDISDYLVARDAGYGGRDSEGGCPFTVVMSPLNGRLEWDLGSLEAKVEAPSPLSRSWRKKLTMSTICCHATLSCLVGVGVGVGGGSTWEAVSGLNSK